MPIIRESKQRRENCPRPDPETTPRGTIWECDTCGRRWKRVCVADDVAGYYEDWSPRLLPWPRPALPKSERRAHNWVTS